MYAIAVAVVLGAVFYGLNNSTVNQAGTSPTSQTAQTRQPPRPRRLRACVTSRHEPTARPARPPARRPSADAAGPAQPDMNKSAKPPADSAPASKQ